MKYLDPNGKVVVKQTLLESMTAYDMPIPKSNSTVNKTGCVIATISNMINNLFAEKRTSIKSIASNPNNFTNEGLDTGNVVERAGAKYSSLKKENGDVVAKFKELDSSDTKYAVGATVKWGDCEDGHTVGINGTREISGKDYFEIAPSSDNDVKGGCNRDSWIKENGKLE